jgi:hypothetical protein
MAKMTDPYVLGSLAEGLSAVAARLEPKEAAKVAATLTQAMARTTKPYALWSLAHGLSAVAARLEPREAARVCAQATASLTQAMAKTTDTNALNALAKGLSALLLEMGSAEQSRRALAVGSVVASLAGTGHPLLPVARITPALAPLPCRLATQQLVDLLKHPTCIGQAQRDILDQLANRYHRTFADQWEFVHFAEDQHLGLDFTSPPRRPAVGGNSAR